MPIRWSPSRLHFKDRLHLDGRAGRDLREAEGAAGMVAVARLAVDLVEQVATAVDHQVLLIELERRIHAPQELQHLQAVERAVSVPDRIQDLDGALPGGGLTF